MLDFNGDTLTITLPSAQTSISAQDIYSEWKVWVVQGNNAAYPEAFRVLGGEPLGGGLFAGSYFFLRNDLGWRIKPPEENISVTIEGNLFGEDANLTIFSSTDGSFNTSIRLQTSSLTQQVITAANTIPVVDPTMLENVATKTDIEEIPSEVWNYTQ